MANDLFSNYGKAVFLTETTYNTDAVAAAQAANTDMTFQELTSISVEPVIVNVDKSRIRDHFSGVAHCPPLPSHLAVNVTGPILGATNPGNAGGESPVSEAIWRACGLVRIVDTGVYSLFRPDMRVNQFSSSMHYWRRVADEAEYRMTYATGLRGSMSLNFDNITGEATYSASMLSANFPTSSDTAEFVMGWSKELAFWDQSSLELGKDGDSITYTGIHRDASGACVTNHTGVLTVDGQAVECTGLTIDLGLSISPKQTTGSSSLTTKVVSVRDLGSRIQGTLSVAETGAGFDKLIGLIMSGAQVELTYVLNTASTDVITVTIPKLQMRTMSESEANGLAAWSFGWAANADTVEGDDGIAIRYAT